MNRYEWVYGNASLTSLEAVKLADKTGVNLVVAALCIARGVETPEDFEKFNTSQIVEFSHKEKAFTDTVKLEKISYDYAFDLNIEV